MLSKPIRTRLRDGTPILIREVEPEDKHLLEIGFSHLSDRSRHFRFLHPVSQISKRQLESFTSSSGHDHVACGALDLSATRPEPIGIARYVRIPEMPDTAEFAVTVVDSHQGRGLGSLFIGTLAALAVSNDVRAFIFVVHVDNTPMIRMLEELGATRKHFEPGADEFRIQLHRDPGRFPETPTGMSVRHAYELSSEQARSPLPAGLRSLD